MTGLLYASLFLFLSVAFTSFLEYETRYGSSTYLNIEIHNLNVTLSSVEIELYDWILGGRNRPVKRWFPMSEVSCSGVCYELDSSSNEFIFLPASLRLTEKASGNVVVDENAFRNLTIGAISIGRTNFGSPNSSGVDGIVLYNLTTGIRDAGTTYFTLANGACFYGSGMPSEYSLMYAAIREDDWHNATHCGECIEINSRMNTPALELLVVDECPNEYPGSDQKCSRLNWLDISPQSFDILSHGNSGWGVLQVYWRYTPCSAFIGKNVSYRVEDWSSPSHISMLVQNHVMGIERVQISMSGTDDYYPLTRTDFNTWEYENSSFPMNCPCRLKLTSKDGQEIVEGEALYSAISSWPKDPTLIPGTVQFAKGEYNQSYFSSYSSFSTSSTSMSQPHNSVLSPFALVTISLVFLVL